MKDKTTFKKDNNTFLILSVFGILFVVFGHCKPVYVFFINVFTYYSFHMALFAFISGYFFKDRKPLEFIKTKVKRLIIPYFCWNIIYGVILTILRALDIVKYGKRFSLYNIFVAPFKDSGNHFAFNVAAWFVITIFFIQIIYYLINKIGKKIKIPFELPLLIIAFIIAYFELKYVQSGHNSGFFYLITRITFLFPFYCIGQLYKKYEDRIHIEGKYTFLFFGVIIIIQTILLEYYDINYNLQLLSFKNSYLIYFLTSLTGIFFWLKISKIVSKYVKDSFIINYIGNNTYSIMMHHVFAIYIFNSLIYLLYSLFGWFSEFDINGYQTHYFYFYNKNPGLSLIYVIIGVTLPLLGNFVYNMIKFKIKRRYLLKNQK